MDSAKRRNTVNKKFIVKYVNQGTFLIWEMLQFVSFAMGKFHYKQQSINTLRQTTFYNQMAYQIIHRQIK